LHVPSHFIAVFASHLPSHFASHEPESLPGSHSTLAFPPRAWVALAAQSAMTFMLAEHDGSFTDERDIRVRAEPRLEVVIVDRIGTIVAVDFRPAEVFGRRTRRAGVDSSACRSRQTYARLQGEARRDGRSRSS